MRALTSLRPAISTVICVEAAFLLVVGVISDQVLAVKIRAEPLDGFLQATLPHESELLAAGALGEDFRRDSA